MTALSRIKTQAFLLSTIFSCLFNPLQAKEVKDFYGIIYETHGDVRLKRFDSFDWVGAKKKVVIARGDLIFTDVDSWVVVRIPKTKREFKIPENTILRFSKTLPKRSSLKREFSARNRSERMTQSMSEGKESQKKDEIRPVTYKEMKYSEGSKEKKANKKKSGDPIYNRGKIGINVRSPADKSVYFNRDPRKSPEEISFAWVLADFVVDTHFPKGEVDAEYKLNIWYEGESKPFCCRDAIFDNGQGEAYFVVAIDRAVKMYFQVSTSITGAVFNSRPRLITVTQQSGDAVDEVDLKNLDGRTIIME